MEKIYVNVHVDSLAKISGDLSGIITSYRDGSTSLGKEYKDLVFFIDYPVNVKCEVKIPLASSIADVLCPIAKAYKEEVYANEEKYGVWGHGIEDLYFEAIIIKENGVSEIIVGS